MPKCSHLSTQATQRFKDTFQLGKILWEVVGPWSWGMTGESPKQQIERPGGLHLPTKVEVPCPWSIPKHLLAKWTNVIQAIT